MNQTNQQMNPSNNLPGNTTKQQNNPLSYVGLVFGLITAALFTLIMYMMGWGGEMLLLYISVDIIAGITGTAVSAIAIKRAKIGGGLAASIIGLICSLSPIIFYLAFLFLQSIRQ